MSDTSDFIRAAAEDRAADIESLAELDREQLRFLRDAHTLEDPLTDELECDSEERLDAD